MKRILLAFAMLFASKTLAGGVGFSVATGLPYLSQANLIYMTSSNSMSFDLAYNNLSVSVGSVTVSATTPEFVAKWHPFQGSFYLGVGYGNQTLKSKSTETISGQSAEASVEVKSTALTPHLGWMWGAANGGFFMGMDFGMQNNSGAQTTVTTNASPSVQSTPEYQQMVDDAKKQGKTYGETGFVTMTFLRIGWLF